MLSTIMLISAALREIFGKSGLIIGATVAGLADTHAAAASVASLVASGKIPPGDAVVPIVASTAVSRAFALRVVPGLILLILGAWTGALAGGIIEL